MGKMTKLKNLKIAITPEQPLDEVVRELERLGYGYWGLDPSDKWIGTSFKNKQFTTFASDVCFNDEVLTTLAELKEMKND